MKHTVSLQALSLLALAACGNPYAGSPRGFDINYRANQSAEVANIAQTIASRSTEAPLATLVVTAMRPARGFTAFDLPSGRQRFATQVDIDARPIAVGDLIVSHSGREVIAWDSQSGSIRWRKPDHGYPLTGAGGDGQTLAMTFGNGGLNRRQGYLLVVDARNGSTLLEREVPQALGTPTAAGGYVFVPWGGQYLSVFDVARNEETTRVHSSDDVFSRARFESGAVYFGGRNLYRFEAEAATGRRDNAVTLAVPRDDLPGGPLLSPDGYEGLRVARNARERVTMIWRTDPTQPHAGLTDGITYALFHRVLFALDQRTGAVRWGHAFTADIAGAEPVRGGIVLVDDQGAASMLAAADGAVRWRQATNTRPLQAELELPIDFAPPATESEGGGSPARTLVEAAGGTDTRLLPARLFAARALGAIEGGEATEGLLSIASRASFPPELRQAAGEALASRRDGLESLVSALDGHYDYVRGTVSPPAGYIAQAFARAHYRNGVAPLIRHLADPETEAGDLPRIAASLRELGDPSAVSAMLDFLKLYHADDGLVPQIDGTDAINDRSMTDQEALASALEQCALAVAAMGTPADRRWIEALIVDPNTLEPLRAAMRRALTPAGAAAATSGTSSTQPSDTVSTDPDIPPVRLSMQAIAQALEPQRERMMQCLAGMTSRPAQVRVQFRYDNEGHVQTPTVAPASLQPCIAPIIQGTTFPRNQSPREIGTYYLIGG